MSGVFDDLHGELIDARAEDELRRATEDAATGAGAGAGTPDAPRLPLVTFEELATRPRAAQRMLVGNILPAEEATLVSARERSFKSFLTMEWAKSVALGRTCMGHFEIERPETVLLFDLENRAARLCDRIEASLARDGLTAYDFHGRLLVFDREQAVRFKFDALGLTALAHTIERQKPALVVVDNLRKATPAGKDEKEGKDMLPLMDGLVSLCEGVGTALVLVHHNRRDDTGFSGSGTISTTSANTINIVRDRQSGIAIVKCDSMRNTEPFAPFAIAMGRDGALRMTDVPERDDEDEPDRGGMILDALRTGALTTAQIATATDLSTKQVRAVLKRLVLAEIVVEAGEWKPDTGKPATLYGLAASPTI